MNCDDARSLIEKLVDEEASAAQAREAKAHLAGCARCRSERDLHEQVARALSRPLPEPPEGYFDALPGRILARIDGASSASVAAPPWWKRLATPGALRWEALAAVLLTAVAVGLVATREGLLEPGASPAADISRPSTTRTVDEAETAPPPASDAPSSAVTPDAPSSAVASGAPSSAVTSGEPQASEPRDALAAQKASAAPLEVPPVARDRRERAQLQQDAAEEAVGGVSGEAPSEEGAFRENALLSATTLEAEDRAAPRAERAAPSFAAAPASDCERWRRALEDLVPGSEPARDARYRLAQCSIDRVRREGTEALRKAALADGDAFLELESEGPRAEEIREALKALRE